jgi:hypothetical protein
MSKYQNFAVGAALLGTLSISVAAYAEADLQRAERHAYVSSGSLYSQSGLREEGEFPRHRKCKPWDRDCSCRGDYVPCLDVSLAAADPVDLRGKKGIVDPADLKKFDPKPRLTIKAPPPPSSK